MTTTTTTIEFWASRLTDDALAAQLNGMATDIRRQRPSYRAALLREAARRLEAK